MKLTGETHHIEHAEKVTLQVVTLKERYTPTDVFWLAFGLTHGVMVAVASAFLAQQVWLAIRSFVAGAP